MNVQPCKGQWWVIWIAVILGLFLAAANPGSGLFAFGAVVLIGALVWQLEGKRKR